MLAVLMSAPAAHAATVRFDVQPRQTYVGVPIALRITIEDAQDAPAPELPELADFTVLGPPSRSMGSTTVIINGRRIGGEQVSYTYRLVPKRAGRLTIPTIRFDVAGESFETNPVIVTVEEPVNDGLMRAEVVGSVDSAYVSEGIRLTLRLTVKPFTDPQYGIRLSDGDMWSLMQTDESQWGMFQPAIIDMAQNRSAPSSKIVRPSGGLSDDDMLYQYEITQVVHPDRAGPIDLGNIVVLMQYPVELDRFFGRYSIERTRPVVATADMPNIVVKPLPEEGRPKLFSGAVGSFTMDVAVKPIDVAVGEPMTLTLTITDRSRPEAQIDVLQAPPLHDVEALARDFRVHEEPLAGVVDGRSKSFTQTIRAQRESVTAVPAIPFSYFDPKRGVYVTISSDAIPITVKPASTLAMSEIVQSNGVAPRATELTPIAGGILANFGDPDQLLRRESLQPSWWLVVILALPPVLFAFVAISHRRTERLRNDPALVRQRHAFSRAGASLDRAAKMKQGAEAQVASAVAGYVADRCNLPPGAHTRADVAACLSQNAVDAQLIGAVTSLLQKCEHAAYTGSANGSVKDLARDAKRIIMQLEKAKWS